MLEFLFVLGAAVAGPILLTLALRERVPEIWWIAALLGAGFIAFSLVPIVREGYFGFVPNHTQDLWGTQVWYDLIICEIIALVFVVPRARKAGMLVPAWVVAVACTASIALLPMVARLFWLERAHARDATD